MAEAARVLGTRNPTSTVVSLLGAHVLAYVICYCQNLHRALLVVLVYSLWVSALIRALAWLILLTDRGIVNETLRQLGLCGGHFMGSSR